jgi:hypothetical protein
MTKIAYNTTYGGFSLSDKALHYLATKHHIPLDWMTLHELPRHHPALIDTLETLGATEAGGQHADLSIVEIDSPEYYIEEYDGLETVYHGKSLKNLIVSTEMPTMTLSNMRALYLATHPNPSLTSFISYWRSLLKHFTFVHETRADRTNSR